MNSGVALLLRATPRISSTPYIPISCAKAARFAVLPRPVAFSHSYYTLDIPLKNRLDLVFPPDAVDMEAAGGTPRARHLCVLVHGVRYKSSKRSYQNAKYLTINLLYSYGEIPLT